MSLVGAKMFNVIDHQLKAIKHTQNEFFSGLDVIMLGDFHQTPMLKFVGFLIPLMIV
jgi:hypothetical protein